MSKPKGVASGHGPRTTIQVNTELARVLRLSAALANEGQPAHLDRVVLPLLRAELRTQIARMHELTSVTVAAAPSPLKR